MADDALMARRSNDPAVPEAPGHGGGSQARKLRQPKAERGAQPGPGLRSVPFFQIEMLPAGHGDALWIEYGDHTSIHRWMIDCGTQQTARELDRRVEAVPEENWI